MSNFLNRLSSGSKKKEAGGGDKASSPASPRSSQTKDDTSFPGSPASSGQASPADDESISPSAEEEELEEDTQTTSGEVTFTDERRALIAQRQSVLPHLITQTWGQYTEDDLKGTKIRGANYLKDKIKVASGPAIYRLAHADIFYTNKNEERITNVTKTSDSYITLAYQRRKADANNKSNPYSYSAWANHPAALTLIVNIVFPGPRDTNMNLVMYYERRVPPAEILEKMKESAAVGSVTNQLGNTQLSSPSSPSPSSPYSPSSGSSNEFGDDTLNGVDISRVRAFDAVLHRLRVGSDAYRDGKLKIIPRVAEGGYIVRKTIGRVPAILGKKVKQSYYLDPEKNSFEIIADIGTSKVAGKIISLIKNTCKSLVVDMTFLLQGDSNDELPESVMGGIRISHCDIDNIQHYNENKKTNPPQLR